MIDVKKKEETLDNGATSITGTVGIKNSDIAEYMDKFDSPQQAMIHSVEVAHEFSKDIDALIESMCNLYEDNMVPLSLLDVELNLTLHIGGELVTKSKIGNKDASKQILLNAMASCIKEAAE